ncbi:LAFE_0G16402g1_1 [Lachancea fermentati]|uniref:Autophagy-related protein 11 n=1 Tax=Lachancea fermentati TaxID=4955 RepID=A0A1G4MIM0_LACFM|nr:LAFE_0G16402g1_1 [Lachancea fermentati]
MSDYNAVIVNAITGIAIQANIRYFVNLEGMKRFISQQMTIPADQCFILLPYGTKLKKSNFQDCLREPTGCEFYVFDRRLFSLVSDPKSPSMGTPDEEVASVLDEVTRNCQVTLIKPITSPLLDADIGVGGMTYRKITSLLTTNMGWLNALEIDAHYFHKIIQETIEQTAEIFKCFGICQQYLKLYCYDVEKLYDSNVEFLNQLTANSNADQWENVFDNQLYNLDTVNNDQQKKLSEFLDRGLLRQHFDKLKELDQRVATKLRHLKDRIDENYSLRQNISSQISRLKTEFQEPTSKYEMEDSMMLKFEEIVSDMKVRNREILNNESSEFTPEYIEEVSKTIAEEKNDVVPKLYTIAQSLFTEATESIASKIKLQKYVIITLGQIAYIQIQILEIKKLILRDCNQDMELLQEYQLRLSQVEDLPIVYGLSLIEGLRQNTWFEQVKKYNSDFCEDLRLIEDNEEKFRRKWLNNFGQISRLFQSSGGTHHEIIRNFISFDRQKFDNANFAQITPNQIEKYIDQLSAHGISTETVQLLRKNLEDVKNFAITVSLKRSIPVLDKPGAQIQTIDTETIKGYKLRIKKLESLLHDAKFSNINSWPTGILNNATSNAFSNTISVNSKISLLLTDSEYLSANNERERDLENIVIELQREMELLKDKNRSLNEDLGELRSKLIDVSDERNAYEETLANMNKELSRLTAEKQLKKSSDFSEFQELKLQLNTISKTNTTLLADIDAWRDKYEKLNIMKDDLLANMANLENDFVKERTDLNMETEELKKEVASLRMENEKLAGNQRAEIEYREAETETSTETESVVENVNTASLEEINKVMESKIFEIFTSDIYILENIGLLLSKSDDSHLQITRVKGLRKNFSQSELNDSVMAFESQTLVKSSVFQEMRDFYEAASQSGDKQARKRLLASIDQLFSSKLYESAVIKRFKDIETLAKKLTKENKFKRNLLDVYQKEKITIKNFQVGDLALFLPTRDAISSPSSSVSSLASSFSSVDLSTPPPMGVSLSQGSSSSKTKNKEQGNINGKARPWAAFTAFDENTRYMLKDNDDFTRNRDWFVGRITSIERKVVNNTNQNPFKLPQGAAWVLVTAEFLTSEK